VSKRVLTAGYIVSWVIAAAVAAEVFIHAAASATTVVSWVAIVIGIASLVMLVTWIGALVKTGGQAAWGWFVALLVLQLVGLGILAMIAYATAGPPDRPRPSVTRPSFT